MKPQPNAVRYNDWRMADVAPPAAFAPSIAVSAIVPYYAAPRETALTLAALERQTYPRDLFEVVVVDDGSPAPFAAPPDSPLNIRVERQDDLGFGLARARNAGAKAAEGDILVFLDCDILVEDDWLAAHARWHHAVSDALTLGTCADVCADGIDADAVRRETGSLADALAGRPTDPRPNEAHLIRTDNLTSRADDPFRAALGGNLGIGADFFRETGGFDESFTRWGMEEIEFAYRAYTLGGLLIPLPDAFGWHQGRARADERGERMRHLRVQRAKIANLIAHRGVRADGAGRIFTVPQYVVSIDCEGRSADEALAAVANILADGESDLAIRIESRSQDVERDEWIADAFGSDPRVRLAIGRALADFPASPFHIRIPAATFGKGLIRRLRAGLGDAVVASAPLPGDVGGEVSISRAWALNRARRTGKTPAAFGEARALPTSALRLRASKPSGGLDGAEPAGYPSPFTRLRHRAREIRGLGGAWRFAKWLTYVARREMRRR